MVQQQGRSTWEKGYGPELNVIRAGGEENCRQSPGKEKKRFKKRGKHRALKSISTLGRTEERKRVLIEGRERSWEDNKHSESFLQGNP